MRTAANIFAAVVCALWAGLLWIGIDLIAKDVPFPGLGQTFFYIDIPAALISTLLCSNIILNFMRSSPATTLVPLVILSVIAFLLLPPYLLVYTGGM
jgi:hypothetical protein